jgi:XRE family transcriptional regulator, master regulator for biofilm formation
MVVSIYFQKKSPLFIIMGLGLPAKSKLGDGKMNGEYIRNRRIEKRLSLSELAQLANVSKTYLSSLERNIQKNPSLDIVKKIADVLEIDPMLLINNIKNNENESIKENTHTPIESVFHLKKHIEELDTKQLENLRDFIDFTLWKKG